MKRTILITAAVVVVSSVSLMVFLRLTNDDKDKTFAEVRKGYFAITVEAMGELYAENSMEIRGPDIAGNRRLRSSAIRISEMVPEGTEVKKGDFVAELDRSGFQNTLTDEMTELKEDQNNYLVKVLDSAVVLSTLRNEIINQRYAADEARIALEQSAYEPPAIQRQAEINLEKNQRAYEQGKKQYTLKRSQVIAELRNLKQKVDAQQRVVDDISGILAAFTIKAPADGMVIYKRDRLGQKLKTGSNYNPWEPVVATLPDMSSMLSKIYISEIEINKITEGLPVEITIDAFPDKMFNGFISSIANIGEQLPNSDTKVFEVFAKIEDFEPQLRPSMTTSNRVIVREYDDVITVPNESIHAEADKVTHVYTKDERKQIVVLGESNGRYTIIEQGLEEGTDVWLTIPEKADKFILAGTELIPVIRDKERELAALEEERIRNYKQKRSAGINQNTSVSSNNTSGSF